MLDGDTLTPSVRAYNAAVARFDGRSLMAYRHEPLDRWNCRIHIAELDTAGNVVSDAAIAVPESKDGENLEDPRLFHYVGGLWLAWTAADYTARSWKSVQRYGRLVEGPNGWGVNEVFQPVYGMNDGTRKEKNWQFFESDGRLFFQYFTSPHVVCEVVGNRVVAEHRSPGIQWAWGKPSGGTPPVPFAPGHLITFFHSYEFHDVFQRRYHAAALVFEDRPPFRQVSYSGFPLLTASEVDPLPAGDKWNPLCVFPCGAVRDGDEWLVSSGVNDCRISLHRFTDEELCLVSVGMNLNSKDPFMRIRVIRTIIVDGHMVLPGEFVTIKRESASDLVRRGRAMPAPEAPAAETKKRKADKK
jgi:predicted GH43/DUF377 family glycosyl hydrolase